MPARLFVRLSTPFYRHFQQLLWRSGTLRAAANCVRGYDLLIRICVICSLIIRREIQMRHDWKENKNGRIFGGKEKSS